MTNPDSTITLERICPLCGKKHSLVLNYETYVEGMEARSNGVCIQDAFPQLTPSERELLLTGTCDSCWDLL